MSDELPGIDTPAPAFTTCPDCAALVLTRVWVHGFKDSKPDVKEKSHVRDKSKASRLAAPSLAADDGEGKSKGTPPTWRALDEPLNPVFGTPHRCVTRDRKDRGLER